MHIFISYTGRHRYDGEVAEQIAAALEECGIDCFLDRKSIEVGDDILRVIAATIDEKSSHLLVLASFAAEKVDWVREELRQAQERGLKLIPMVIAARDNEIPDFVRGLKPLVAPLGREVATLFEYLGLEKPPNLDREIDPSFLPALCNRTDEETLFEQSLNERHGQPKFYCLVGDYRERHDLFVDRVSETLLRTYARWLVGDDETAIGSIRETELKWPVKWPLRHRLRPLLEALSRKLNRPWPKPEQLTESAIAELVGGFRETVLVITHPIPPEHWKSETSRLLLKYLAFWRDVVKAGLRKQVVVFFTIEWGSNVNPGVRRNVDREIATLVEKVGNSKVLPPLTPIRFGTVTQSHVDTWVNDFADIGLGLRTKTYCRELFKTLKEQPLDAVIDEFKRAFHELTEKKTA
ncbi:MAG TPA: TIR domain-containing protein [Thermoanaerobaculia bacterium]|nr:TIR domain-containing protein [Thermoanaerobaculia bacterium]